MRRRKKPRQGLVQVGALLEDALQALGASGDYEKFRVEKKCREALGDKLSKALAGVTMKDRTVELEFNHSIWLNEMNFRKAEVLQKLRMELPGMGLKDLVFRLARNAKG